MHTLCATHFEEWLQQASALIAAEIPPHAVCWEEQQGSEAQLFSGTTPCLNLRVECLALPRFVHESLRDACAFLGEERWALPYRVLWRWRQGDHSALLPGDVDGSRLTRRMRAVLGAAHQMKGFLRFCERAPDAGDPRFVAWYEPAHEVLALVAAHFAERMGQTTWLIATPRASARYDGKTLSLGPPIAKPLLDKDLTEDLWLNYYRSTFNPERLNPELMQAHLPKQHWKNLPEAALIPSLVSAASLGSSRQALAEIPASPRNDNANCMRETQPRSAGLGDALEACRRCELWEHATYPVGGSGPSNARIAIIGEQADDHDDLIGEPFSGELGRFLDQLLQESGLARELVYLSHAVKHFHFETRQLQRLYRSPQAKHLDACKMWLQQELNTLAPHVILALGRNAAAALDLIDIQESYQTKPVVIPSGRYQIIPTWHPGYALRAADPVARNHARMHIINSLCLAKTLANM